MRKLFIFLLIIVALQLVAIDFYSLPQKQLQPAKAQDLYYHNNIHDQNYYGSASWAVKYDLTNYYPQLGTLQFSAESAKFYCPITNSFDDVILKVCYDNAGQPGEIYYSQEFNPQYGWNEIEFSAVTDSLFWVVLDYPTNPSNQFVAASAVDGNHSYFWDEDYGPDGYYRNMGELGFNSELIINLVGEFQVEGVELELTDFQLLPYEDNEYYPIVEIENNSGQQADFVYLNLNISSPETTIKDSLVLPTITAQGSLVFNGEENAIFYQLEEEPSEYEARARVGTLNETIVENNIREITFDNFEIEFSQIIIENAVNMQMNSYYVWEAQEVLENSEITIINYFADANNQPFYNEAAVQRFNYYELIGYPYTIVNGMNKIVGYESETYEDSLNSLLQMQNPNTFVQENNFNASYLAGMDEIFIEIELENPGVHVFNSTLINTDLWIGVIQDSLTAKQEIPGSIMIDILYQKNFPELLFEQTFEDTFTVNKIFEITPVNEDYDNCSLIYWLQNSVSKQIYQYNSILFTDMGIVDNQTEIVPQVVKWKIFPNPFTYERGIKIDSDSNIKEDLSHFKIYNIKGQQVNEIKNSNVWFGLDKNGRKVAPGIYFIKPASKDIVKRCILIK